MREDPYHALFRFSEDFTQRLVLEWTECDTAPGLGENHEIYLFIFLFC